MPRPACRCGDPKPSRAASMARAIWRRRVFGKRRTAARNGCERSICNVSFQIAGIPFDRAGLACAGNLFVHAFDESIELFLSYSVLLKCVVIRMHVYGAKRDHFIAVENPDIFAVGGAFQQGREIRASAGGGECSHATILRRYREQLKLLVWLAVS
jgi:hypothetical protein